MQQTDSTSFSIGEAFEDYIQNEIFTKDIYDLIHRTNSYKQNSERYCEESKRPDFKFRCRVTKQEFHVEAKFRSKFNIDDKLHVLDIGQYNRYKEIDKLEQPVLVLIGYEGAPNDPRYLSLIRIDKIGYLDLYRSVLKKNDIKKIPLNSNLLQHIVDDGFSQNATNKSETADKKLQDKPTLEAEVSKNKIDFRMFLAILLIIFGFLSISLYFMDEDTEVSENSTAIVALSKSQEIELKIKDNISKYYKAFDNNDIDALDYFINSNIDRWYSKYNVSLTYIKNDTKRYIKKFPYHETQIQWKTFKFSELPNDNYSVSYSMIYKIKSNVASDYKQYSLNIKSIWSANMKMKSMYEVQVN